MFTDLCEIFSCICGNLLIASLYAEDLSYIDTELSLKPETKGKDWWVI